MCGRFAVALEPEAVVGFYGLEQTPQMWAPRYNVAPSQPVAIVRLERAASGQGGGRAVRRLAVVRWGLVPAWAKAPDIGARLVNARVETVATKPAFRAALRARRCVVPASGFYEWSRAERGRKQPWFFRRRDGDPLSMAAIWERWRAPTGEVIESMAIVTTAADATVRPVHGRMPLVLERDELARWLDPELDGGRVIEALSARRCGERLEGWPVSMRVNRTAVDDPGLVVPVRVQRTLFS